MSTLRKIFIAAVVLALAPAACAWALEADDVVRMVKAKAGDEVVIAQMKAAKARFVLTADDIIRLKKEGVSDAVIKAMIETVKPEPKAREAEAKAKDADSKEPAPAAEEKPASEPARGVAETAEPRRPADKPALAKAPVPAPAKEPASAREPEPVRELGTLVLENLDSRDYSVQVDAERRNVFFYKASGAEWREPLPARGSQIWRLPAGAYRLTWVGGSDSHTLKVANGKESRATLTRTSGEGFEAVYLSLFEDGERRGGGRLVVLADRTPASQEPVAAAPAPTPVVTQTVVAAPPVVQREYYYAASPVYAPAPVYYGGYSRYSSGHGYSHGSGYGYYGLGLIGRVSIPLGHHGRLGIGFGF